MAIRTGLLLLTAVLGIATVCLAQHALRPEFQVASVKLDPPLQPGERYSANLGTARNGTVTLSNATLSDCIKFAYELSSDSQIFGPDWIKSREVRFDIVGKTDPRTDRDELLLMLQSLLADRLKLGVHEERRPLQFYALVQDPRGTKLATSNPDQNSSVATINSRGRIVNSRLLMSGLATLLSRFEREIVIDMTGLEGPFDVRLEWDADNVTGPSLFTALQEQLGLKLESRKGPMDVLVVDYAERTPDEN
jgi:uncharacterized protein (TIGR03435 family)